MKNIYHVTDIYIRNQKKKYKQFKENFDYECFQNSQNKTEWNQFKEKE